MGHVCPLSYWEAKESCHALETERDPDNDPREVAKDKSEATQVAVVCFRLFSLLGDIGKLILQWVRMCFSRGPCASGPKGHHLESH